MPGRVINFFSSVILLFILSILFPDKLFPQYEIGTMRFLSSQQSPLLIGAGSIGTAIPMKDAMGFYYNPAQLGYFSRENNFSYFFMPEKADWHDILLWEWYPHFTSTGLTAGFNFRSTKSKLPLSIGIGYIHNKITYTGYTTRTQNDETSGFTFENYDYFDCFSVGACYEYYLLFNIGFAVKPYGSDYTNEYEYPVKYKRSSTAFDFGAMITVPVAGLLLKNKIYDSDRTIYKPKFDFTFGYSITNIGKKYSRINEANASSIQRTARLGYTIDIGLDAETTGHKIFNVIDYSFTAEVEDKLWRWNEFGTIEKNQNLLGDIKIGKNLILLKPDSYVSIHKGHILRVAETVLVSFGYENRYANGPSESTGFGISSEGIVRLFAPFINSSLYNDITNHFKMEYYFAEDKYEGLALYIKGIEI